MAVIEDLTGHAGNEVAKEAVKLGKFNLRASSIGQFIRCPHQYFQFNIAGAYRGAPSAAAALGTAVHKGMEVGLLEKIATGKLPPVSVITDAAHQNWMAASEDDELTYNDGGGESFTSVDDMVVSAAKNYRLDLMPSIEPIATERVLTRIIENHPLIHAVQGSIDIEEERGVSDLKVTKDKTTAAKHIIQLSTYKLLREENDLPTMYATIDNVIKGRKMDPNKVRTERIDVKVSTAYARHWINQILATTEEFHKTGDDLLFRGTSPDNNFLCNPNWCSIWDTCPHVAGLRGTGKQQVKM